MKTIASPLWMRMCSPSSGNDELSELRFSLSHNEHIKQELEAFLYAKWCYLNSKARVELDADMRNEYQHSAHTIAELSGMLFGPDKPTTTTKILPDV